MGKIKLHSLLNYLVITGLFMTLCFQSFSQHSLIPTGTTSPITLSKVESTVVINGVHNFLAKCTGNCDELIVLNPPGPLNYFNAHLNILDTSHFYLSSFAPSTPYHAIVSRSIDGGQNWTTVLDTLSGDFFTLGLFVFDTNRIVMPVSLYRTFVTINGGNVWEEGPQYGMLGSSTTLKVNDSTAILGSLQQFSITKNKGNTWNGTGFVQSAPTSFFATSVDSIYAVTDGGTGTYFCYIFGLPQTDRVDKLIPMMEPAGIYAVSKDEIYVTGKGWPQEHGRIMKTTDLGNTWSYYDVPETEKLLEMVFLNDTMALIGGYDGALVKWNKNSPMIEWGLGVTENSNGEIAARAYPNPVSQQQGLEISTIVGEKLEIQLYDLQGRDYGLLYSGFADSDKASVMIDLQHLAPGVYIYHLRMGERTGQLRFVKQ